MSAVHTRKIASELNINENQVSAVVGLLDEGATVPFIARYRKERTGSLDEVFIIGIRDRVQQLRDLDARKEAILKSIKEQEKLTPELEKQIRAAETMSALEDIYLPYKPKRKTKASIAREKGLEPLADQIFAQGNGEVEDLAAGYISDEKGVESVEAALQGARDIIAEKINEDPEVRKKMRGLFEKEAMVVSKVIKGKETEGAKYKDYFDWSEKLSKIPSHRLLAIRRGEREMILSVDILPDEGMALNMMERQVIEQANSAGEQVKIALKDAYKRLLKPSMETEARLGSKKTADTEAIGVFTENLKQLLLSAPLGQKNVMGVDPGFRTGCKIVCLNRQGKLIDHTAIYPNEPQKQTAQAGQTIKELVKKNGIEAIAIGNGTASRETEQFIRGLGLPANIVIAVVSESGASIYSASAVAREEFPDHDLTVRGAVSIGRRMMDPLAELVKLDPKSIGVGQYQHDVDQTALKNSLDDTVMGCVNAVGVELNTASKELLTYVSGLGPVLAENIVKYRNENGPFKDRASLKKVQRLGDKAFEQAAGFLRVRDGKNLLDASAVHPESYAIVKAMAKDLNCTVEQLIKEKSLRDRVDLKKYVTAEVGMPTLQDIMQELDKPGRDPREQFEVFQFQDGVQEMSDLKVGMQLPGIVTNITKFGAFVDVGVHQDGLVHVSQLSDNYISDPAEVVKLQQHVNVTVTEVDLGRKRIALSMKSDPFGKAPVQSRVQSRMQSPVKKRTQSQHGHQQKQREKPQAEGDLQAKLSMLKGKFGNR
ncbi:MAG: Tex family protein [Cyclobacteriaceae bacterium]